MARAQGDYWQATRGPGHGDARMPVLAPMDVPEAVELTQLAFHLAARWRNPVLLFGDYYLAHTSTSVTVAPLDLGRRPGRRLVARRVHQWHRPGAAPVAARHHQAQRARRLRPRRALPRAARRAPRRCWRASTPLVETGFTDDADVVVVAFGTPAKYVRAAVARLRGRRRAGRVRASDHAAARSRPTPSPRAAAGARVVAVYENNQGQMVDDVRLAVAGAVPGRVHRRPQPRRLGLRHRARPRRRLPARPDRGAARLRLDR